MRSRTCFIACAVAMFVFGHSAYGRVFINEVDYDNAGTDNNEWIELAGTLGSSLDGWTLELVNGAGDVVYDTIPLSNNVFTNETGSNWGFWILGVAGQPVGAVDQVEFTTDGVQNGAPDGIRLKNAQGVVVQYLSYEGTMTGTTESTALGDNNADATTSLFKSGVGSATGDFAWSNTANSSTRGAVNTSQTLNDITIVSYDFNDAAGTTFTNAAEFTAANVTSAAWTDTDANGVTDFAGNPGRALADTGWDNGNGFITTLTVAANYVLDLSEVSFDDQASGTGPTSWQFLVNNAVVAGGSTHASFLNNQSALALTGLTGAVTLELRATGASSGGGTWRVDNFMLTGGLTFTPPPPQVPAPAVLPAGFVLLGLAAARRRR